MGRPARWKEYNLGNGIGVFELSSWKYFNAFVCDAMLNYSNYIYRGQRKASWQLEPSLDRLLRQYNVDDDEWNFRVDVQLNQFKLATRGRRGINPPVLSTDNEWWALGQHNGLKTPLLDWTRSPFVAAFFAYVGEADDNYEMRSIYAINYDAIEYKSREILDEHKGEGRAPIIETFTPMTDENSRLVSQGGLFTRAPNGVDIESWIRSNFDEVDGYILIKILLPNKDRAQCLKSLNRMNVNYSTLFPDLLGASEFCNLSLLVGH